MIPEDLEKNGEVREEEPRTGLGKLIQGLAKKRKSQSGVVVAGIDDMLVRFAKCCSPVPGDPIVGYVTIGRGITVHAMGCDTALHMDPERKVDVMWDDKSSGPRQVQLRVTTESRPGLLSSMSNVFTEAKVNILNANCKTQRDGRAINLFLVEVRDTEQLRAVMRNLDQVHGVIAVERVGA